MGDRVLDRDAHIGRTQVRFHRTIHVLDHRVHARLRVHDDADAIVVDSEQVMRLDGLESLVHECRGVDGDLGPHLPRGVRKCVRCGDPGQLLARPPPKGPAACGEPEGRDITRVLTKQALEQCRVLRVDRDHLSRSRKTRHERAAHHEGLLVGESERRT